MAENNQGTGNNAGFFLSHKTVFIAAILVSILVGFGVGYLIFGKPEGQTAQAETINFQKRVDQIEKRQALILERLLKEEAKRKQAYQNADENEKNSIILNLADSLILGSERAKK